MGVYSLAKSSINNWVKYPNMMAGSVELSSDFLISQTVLGSTTASVTFDVSTLAAQGFKHLQIRYVSRGDGLTGLGNQNIRFNGDSGANYNFHELYTTGSSVASDGAQSRTSSEAGWDVGSQVTANAFIGGVLDILDFANTSKYKTTRALSGVPTSAGGQGIKLGSSLWQNTAAITSISIYASGNFVVGSRFSLYASKG